MRTTDLRRAALISTAQLWLVLADCSRWCLCLIPLGHRSPKHACAPRNTTIHVQEVAIVRLDQLAVCSILFPPWSRRPCCSISAPSPPFDAVPSLHDALILGLVSLRLVAGHVKELVQSYCPIVRKDEISLQICSITSRPLFISKIELLVFL
jgi:hypothetical protein